MEDPGYRKLYSSAEKRRLIDRLLEMREQMNWSSVSDNPDLVGVIPSRRTLYRIFGDPHNTQIRDTTALQIENLLRIIHNSEAEVASAAALAASFYGTLRRLLSVSTSRNIEFLRRYKGHYRCIRMTTDSREILVTYLRILRLPGEIPGFVHVEAIPSPIASSPGRQGRILRHEGYVFPKDRKATFVAPGPNLRQMSCLLSSNPEDPAFSGLLLTESAASGLPFVARVFVDRGPEIDESDLLYSGDYGLFSLDDERYSHYLSYIENRPAEYSVLYANTAL